MSKIRRNETNDSTPPQARTTPIHDNRIIANQSHLHPLEEKAATRYAPPRSFRMLLLEISKCASLYFMLKNMWSMCDHVTKEKKIFH